MNQEVVRKAWGWNGVIESDCGAISGLGDNPAQFHNRVDGHLNAPNLYGAAVLGVNATVDMQCDRAYSAANLVRAVNGSLLTKVQLQEAVNRTFFGRFQTGEFDSDIADPQLKEWRSLGNETVRDLSFDIDWTSACSKRDSRLKHACEMFGAGVFEIPPGACQRVGQGVHCAPAQRREFIATARRQTHSGHRSKRQRQ
jgi:beta-glucosidase-like glycosyl hydrolase